MKKQIIKIGFDLDGVILYNPLVIGRPIIAFIKQKILRKRKTKFYVPKNTFSRWILKILHKSSLFVAKGFDRVPDLSHKMGLDIYIVTARFGFLQSDLDHWLRQINASKLCKAYFMNKENEQPHLFKEKKILDLKLNYFVEDNWDIVNHLQKSKAVNKLGTKILWISNYFDRNIAYKYKFANLNQAISFIENSEK